MVVCVDVAITSFATDEDEPPPSLDDEMEDELPSEELDEGTAAELEIGTELELGSTELLLTTMLSDEDDKTPLLTELELLLLPPFDKSSPDEQERVNVKANPRAAA